MSADITKVDPFQASLEFLGDNRFLRNYSAPASPTPPRRSLRGSPRLKTKCRSPVRIIASFAASPRVSNTLFTRHPFFLFHKIASQIPDLLTADRHCCWTLHSGPFTMLQRRHGSISSRMVVIELSSIPRSPQHHGKG